MMPDNGRNHLSRASISSFSNSSDNKKLLQRNTMGLKRREELRELRIQTNIRVTQSRDGAFDQNCELIF